MLLKHMREPPDGLSQEDTFEALDEHTGETVATCAIYQKYCPELFPVRPMRIFIDLSENANQPALLGAAVARARELAATSGKSTRIFTQVEPNDDARMAALAALGFKDNDGLVLMCRELPASEPESLPYGCVLVRDELEDPLEQKYFLERYNKLFSEEHSFEWLENYRAHDNFSRNLIVSYKGMVGEIISWTEDEYGVIGWLHVSHKWRGRGISQILFALACAKLYEREIPLVQARIQVRIPHLLKIMETAGFKQSKLLLRYPGIDN